MREFLLYRLQKLVRFLLTDREAILKVSVILVFTVIVLAEMRILAGQDKRLALLRSQPKIETAKPVAAPAEIVKEEELILQGVIVKWGTPYAVISGEIYKKGDLVREHEIIEIELDSIILKNKEDGKIKQLYFGDLIVP